jgi:hypothetical protein
MSTWRFGIFWGNANPGDWPRSDYADQASIPGIVNAIKQTLANPAPHSVTIRAIIGGALGSGWQNETDEWLRWTLASLSQEFTDAENALIAEAFPP